MKKIYLLLVIVISSLAGYSQSLDDISDMMVKKDFAAAKAAIDKDLADEKNASKPEAWYYKGRVYNSYSYEKSTPESDLYNLKVAAFEAFKKNQLMDNKDVRMKIENYGSYLDLYYGFYDLGANLFNNKKYSDAFDAFKKSLEVGDYILSKKYTYPQATLYALDTALVLNTAIAATQAKKEDESITYYRKITDANVSGEGYKEVYEYLVEYYNKKGNSAELDQIMAKAKRFYPSNNYWNQVELDNIAAKGDKNVLLAKYEEMITADPENFALNYNYAVELYNKNYGGDDKQSDVASKEKLTNVLKKTIAIDKGIDATVLMANHTYNMASEAVSAASLVKGNKPEDVKKKTELKAVSNKRMDECISYSDQVVKFYEGMTDLKPKQSANYKIVLGYLTDIYNLKADAKKSAEYEKKRAALK